MSRGSLPGPMMVGNDVVLPPVHLAAATPVVVTEPMVNFDLPQETGMETPAETTTPNGAGPTSRPPLDSQAPASLFHKFLSYVRRHAAVAGALVLLVAGACGLRLESGYWSGQLLNAAKPVRASASPAPHIAGLNALLTDKQLQAVTSQPAVLNLGSRSVPISADTIHDWLQITRGSASATNSVHIDTTKLESSLTKLVDQYVTAPINQVTVTHNGVSSVILAGVNGTKLSTEADLKTQADQLAKTLLGGTGFRINAPLVSVPFQAVTPAAFSKLIEVNLSSKQMYFYQNGQLIKSYAVDAGGPATPTPTGEFHIWEKLPMQTMSGYNINGTKYVQPDVEWVNYFDHSGDAIHGNYWVPYWHFGVISSSHGCVSVPDNEAEWIYNWAPIGTTVINYN